MIARLPSRQTVPGAQPRGMTLVELMVVVSILVLLVAAVVPRVQPMLADREIREAARQISTYIDAAKARASRRGRSAGIWLQRSTVDPAVSIDLSLAEVPPPYSGDTMGAKAKLNGTSVSLTGSFNLSQRVKSGDRIRFDNKGRYYVITTVSSSTLSIANVGVAGPRTTPPPLPQTGQYGVPFQIYRQPIRSSAGGLVMPGATCVDLGNSGPGSGANASQNFSSTGSDPIVLMFEPDGSLSTIYKNGVPEPATQSIHLLVGSIDQQGTENLSDMANRWVSIGVQTGLVTVVENGPGASGEGAANAAEAREYVFEKQSMGGR